MAAELITIALLVLILCGIIYLTMALNKIQHVDGHADGIDNIIRLIKEFKLNNEQTVSNEISTNRKEAAELSKMHTDSLDKRMSLFGETQNKTHEVFTKNINKEFADNNKKMDAVILSVEKKLESIQKDNNQKLEAMRETVDEKLHATLEKRFNESFKVVGERLESVHKALGEMRKLESGVGDLQKVLSNVKSRGTWGEASLGNLMEDFLTPDQYIKNAKPKNNRATVEYAVKLPGHGTELDCVLIPIDSKFPLEDYNRLIEAQEEGDKLLIEECGKDLERAVMKQAKTISEAYLNPPVTTDFAIMFVPSESLFAEIVRRFGLLEKIQTLHRVTLAGPANMQAMLNTMQMGFRTLVIQKKTSEVWDLLATIKKEFGLFGTLLEKTHKKITEVGNVIQQAKSKSRTIERKMKDVESLPSSKSTTQFIQSTNSDDSDNTEIS